MTDNEAFLATIAARPDDDLPRLVYADFLEEAGQAERAELIRVQCELASTNADRQYWRSREHALLNDHKPEWRIPGLIGTQQFRRGFIEEVETTAESLLGIDPSLLVQFPIRSLRVVNADRLVRELIRSPIWKHVEVLSLNNNSFGTNGQFERFLNEANLARLHTLSLRNNQLWAGDVHILTSSKIAPQLRRLDLSGNPITDTGLEVLASSAGLMGLTQLIVRSDELHYTDSIHAMGAATLARSRTLTHLKELNLAGHYIGDAGLIDLARSPNMAALAILDVSYNDIGTLGETGIETLVESQNLAQLRELKLTGNAINRLAIEALLRWPRLESLQVIDLTECELTAESRMALAQSPWANRFQYDPEPEA